MVSLRLGRRRGVSLLGSDAAEDVTPSMVEGVALPIHTIRQEGRRFSSESVTIRKGETLTFLNDDSVPHNIASISKGSEFDLGSQLPGTSTDVTFNEAGDVLVICAIHPRMKMLLKITD